ncbi:hypothetical protein MCC01954_11580 [Bifidobacteriaceae bacterium MCC01954]|nr:hypothetical protein MCC01954_11580 [Bifidobacteriaceae bacterium MCC01954]
MMLIECRKPAKPGVYSVDTPNTVRRMHNASGVLNVMVKPLRNNSYCLALIHDLMEHEFILMQPSFRESDVIPDASPI